LFPDAAERGREIVEFKNVFDRLVKIPGKPKRHFEGRPNVSSFKPRHIATAFLETKRQLRLADLFLSATLRQPVFYGQTHFRAQCLIVYNL
jgi:hypothetical protein